MPVPFFDRVLTYPTFSKSPYPPLSDHVGHRSPHIHASMICVRQYTSPSKLGGGLDHKVAIKEGGYILIAATVAVDRHPQKQTHIQAYLPS